ncbi:carbohydrate kinase family protein [Streptomyces sp. NPDC053048]|uniref:carbohydrate kinase family protein n=1 Tax=Streptomyces sp. NPDC053048 TaxID=3365694 RepID=UPI0037D46949
MRIAVTGSIATDHLMTFPGRFAEQLIPGQLDHVSLSFLVDELEVRRGGAAANIAFGLGSLGLPALLVGAVGGDFAEYRIRLKERGVDTDAVRVSETRQTARFVCVTDRDQNQIAVFYAGAMREAREIDLRDVVRRAGDVDLVVVSPDDPEAMLVHTRQCRTLGVPFAADPSQQLARLDGPAVRELVQGARWLFTNGYEAALLLERTGWRREDVLERVGAWVTTHGADGVRVERHGEDVLEVPAVPATAVADPTGVGDAFRAGFLAAAGWGLGDRRAAQLGAALATLVVESVGTQEYVLEPERLLERIAAAYGEADCRAIGAALSRSL